MLSLLNPTALLAAVVLGVGLFAGGGYVGYDYARGHAAQRISDAQQVALESARLAVEQDKQAAIERARKDALAAERARAARSRGVADANLKARNDRSRDAESLGLLHGAIDAANGAPNTALRLPDRLPSPGEAGGRGGQGGATLGVRHD